MWGEALGARAGTGRSGTAAGVVRIASRITGVIRRIAGMPDYAGHLDHLRRCHPERVLPTEKEFFEEYLRCRYGGGVTRCC